MKKNIVYILGVVLYTLIVGMLAICFYTPTEDTDKFYRTSESLMNSFNYTGYEEIMKEKSHVLAQPLERNRVENDDNFILNQKLFVYKSDEAIILLQMTPVKGAENEWTGSLDYSSMLFNSIDSPYKGTIDSNIPNVAIAYQSFSFDGCHYSTICLSAENEKQIATRELIAFNNELIKFLAN